MNNNIDLRYFDHVNRDFEELTAKLDAEFKLRNGQLQQLYSQYNRLNEIKDVVLAFDGTAAVACGSLKRYNSETYEIKRIFVEESYRKNGIATEIMKKLELIAIQKNAKYLILETGVQLTSATELYKSLGFEVIENYGQYVGMKESICFNKKIAQ